MDSEEIPCKSISNKGEWTEPIEDDVKIGEW